MNGCAAYMKSLETALFRVSWDAAVTLSEISDRLNRSHVARGRYTPESCRAGRSLNGRGESNIRRWIITNDWLEAIVALPLNMFYNTGIATYICRGYLLLPVNEESDNVS